MIINKREIIMVAVDVVLVTISLVLAYLVRFGGFPQEEHFSIYLIGFVILVRISCNYVFKLYYLALRYVSTADFVSIFMSVSVGSAFIVTAVAYKYHEVGFSRGVFVIDWLLCVLLISTARFYPRLSQHFYKKTYHVKKRKPALIIGAGDAGEMVARELLKHQEAGYVPVGFVDDNKKKKGLYIHRIPVLGNRNDIARIVEQKEVEEIIVSIPSALPSTIKEFVEICEQTDARVKIVPAIHEIISGDVSISQIRDVEIDDLLGRESIDLDINKISSYLTGKTVVITGAGGSIGSELSRQALKYSPVKLLLLGHGENSIYQIERELKGIKTKVEIVPVIADVLDKEKMDRVFRKYKPEVVFHTAAYKHVPMMEFNADEAVKNNIFGTKVTAELANKHKVERFVLISTDKAVNPTSIMGATKRTAEMVVRGLAFKSKTDFMTVRFGNVLGSRGSIIPLFKEQIAKGGPVTVTHSDVVRYFMTMEEAVQLVVQAGAMGEGGEMFVLDMGKPVKIIDLARDLIKLSGFTPDEEIKIEIVGLRHGEKLYEEMLTKAEGITATKHKKIFVSKPEFIDYYKLTNDLGELEILARRVDDVGIVEKLKEMIPEYQPFEHANDSKTVI